MREYYADIVRNTAGDVVEGATVTVYLAGTLTVATIYANSTDVIAVANILTDVNGKFTFYISYSDYSPAQLFDITIVKGAASQTYEDIKILGEGVLVSSNDTTPGFLNGKLIAGNGISLTEGSDGGNETLALALYLASQAQGDLIIRGASAWERLAKGLANYKFFMNAAGTTGEWAAGIKFGTFTRDLTASSGNAAVTGVGFIPSAVIFLSYIDTTSNAVGIDAGGGNAIVVLNYDAGTHYSSSSASIYMYVSGGNFQRGIINSLDSDGFTIAYTKSGSPTGTGMIYYLAFR